MLIFDYDYIKYQLAAAGEKRSIVVTHPTGVEEHFKTRTEFYGHWKQKNGGWLAEYNNGKKSPLTAEEWVITDVQTPEPVEYVLSSVKHHILNICEKLNVDQYRGYIGKGDSFRVELSTLLKYKGNRQDMLRPMHLSTVEDYLIKHHDAVTVNHLEADDKVVMDCYNTDNILVGVDKDYRGVNNLLFYNVDEELIIKTGNGLGKLILTEKGSIKGYGRLFFYFQVLSGDSSDNYCANCMSNVKWGDKKAYTALKDVKTDKQALQVLVDCYKMLYPEKKIVTGWRGDEIEIDWFYVMNENFNLARMLRWEGDEVKLEEVFDKLNMKTR